MCRKTLAIAHNSDRIRSMRHGEEVNNIVYKQLKSKMKEQRFSVKALGEAADIKTSTLQTRLSGKTEFRFSEIKKISSVLGIKMPDICVYFEK